MSKRHWIGTGFAAFFIALVGGGYYWNKKGDEAKAVETVAAKAQADKNTAAVREIAEKLDRLDKLDGVVAETRKNGLRAACNQDWVETAGKDIADEMRSLNRDNRVVYARLEGEMRNADALAKMLPPAPPAFPRLERIEDGAFGIEWTEQEPGPSFDEEKGACSVGKKSGPHHEKSFVFTADWRQVATFATIRAKEVALDDANTVADCDDDECKRSATANSAERFALDFLARFVSNEITPFLKGKFTEEVRKKALPVLNDPARLTSATSWVIPLVIRFAPRKTMEPFHGWLSLLWKGSRADLKKVAEEVAKDDNYATNDLTRWNAFFLRRWNAAEKDSEGSGKTLITTWQTQVVRIGRAIDHPDVALWAKTLRQEWEKSHPTGHGALLASIAP